MSDSRVATVVNVLADLCPSARAPGSRSLMIPTEWFQWRPLEDTRIFGLLDALSDTTARPPERLDSLAFSITIDRDYGERLAAVDRVRNDHRPLRVGWLWVAGSRPVGDGRRQRVFHPLVSAPLKFQVPPLLGRAFVVLAGDVVVSDLVTNRDQRQELEASLEFGGGALDNLGTVEPPGFLLDRLPRLHRFAQSAAAAAGFDATNLVPVEHGPDDYVKRDGLVIVAGLAFYAADEVGGLSAGDFLREWSTRSDIDATAFASLYGLGDDGESPSGPASFVSSPFPLTPAQRDAVSRSRRDAVTVVSGGPGTGKSQTVVAMALAAVGRGERVLVAAKSDAAVDALLDLFEDAPGPRPVLFGADERRRQLAEELAAGQLQPARRGAIATARQEHADAAATAAGLWRHIADALAGEIALSQRRDVSEQIARRAAPDFFVPSCDLADARRLARIAQRNGSWLQRRAGRRALRRLRAMAGSADDVAVPALQSAIISAARARRAEDTIAAGGTDLERAWSELAAADAAQREAHARWLALAVRDPENLRRGALGDIAVLATALRSGRAARRAQLARVSKRLTRALPLWIGTLADIEDLLPAVPGLFDLVLLDEASGIDQPLAAPALLRAKRAAIVGDPRQLRHVSFLGDDARSKAAAAHGLDDPGLVGRLDVRRNSTFDVAVGASTVSALDEHFRSDPHLIDFVARRLYGDGLKIATRTPMSENCDCIDIIRLAPRESSDGVLPNEVEAVVATLRAWLADGHRSVGVVSPFRAQADAIEATVLDALTIGDIEALDLRIGTVHGFQGNERDHVIVSLGVGPTDSDNKWRFVADPHLFAVLATRARESMTWIVSAEPPAGLLADYFAAADSPPGRPVTDQADGSWAREVADRLDAAGVPATTRYPVGRHLVDVCAGSAERFLGVECAVHPDGAEAHIERRLTLMRASWRLAEAYPSKWADRIGELVVHLSAELRGPA